MKYDPIPGVKITQNEKNKFVVFELHYSADPDKATEEWLAERKSKMSLKKWMQEMEIQWDTHAGNPVYTDWKSSVHEVSEPIEPELGLPILVGVDFGLTPAAVIGQLQDSKLVIFAEVVAFNMGAERFSKKLKSFLLTNYPNWANHKKDILMFVDPSGFFRKDTDEGTCAAVLRDNGFMPIAGPVTWEERRSSVEHFLVLMKKGEPCFAVYGPNCKMLVKGFNGGYMYSEKAFDIEPSKIRPVKNEFSHCHDALQYLCSGISKTRAKSKRTKIPEMGYTFSLSQRQSTEEADERFD